MVDKTKIMQEARKFLAKGQVDKAIEEYQKLSKASPDGNIFNTIGDLYIKSGNNKAAVEEYHNAAKHYTDEGFSLKALAIHKKVLNINPKDAPALIALGQLNEEKNIVTDAIKYYLAAADVISKDGKKEDLLAVYDKILNLAPTNIKLRIKVSQLFSNEGFIPEAAREYCNIGRLFAKRNDLVQARAFYTTAIEIQPSNKDVLIALADLAEIEGNLEEAAGHILNAIEKDGESSELLLKQAHLNIKTGMIDEGLDSLNKLLELEPDNYNIRIELGDLYQQTGDIMAAWEEYKQVITPIIEEGRSAEAISILETFKELEAIDNRIKLIDLYKANEDMDKAFKELYNLHVAYTEQAKIVEAFEVLKQARMINPDDEEVNQAIAELDRMLNPPEPDREAADQVEEAPAPEDIAAESVQEPMAAPPASPSGEKSLPELLNEADVFIQYGLLGDAQSLLEAERMKYPSHIDIHLKLKTVYMEMKEVDQAVTECIILSALYKSSGDEAQSQAMLMNAFGLNPHDSRLEGKVDGWSPEPVAAPEPAPVVTPEISPEISAVDPQGSIDATMGVSASGEQMIEADFHMQQGFYGEAAAIYRELLVKSPGDATLTQKLADTEAKLAEATPAVAPEAPKQEKVIPFAGESEESLFDFSSVLESDEAKDMEVDAMDADVLDIFNEFKKGLSMEVETEDSATHYDLGIAYKEMGLLDDSIKEFQTAQRDPAYYSQCMTMMGLCYMQKGTFALAIDAYSAALMKTDAHDDKRWSLKYDLGQAYESAGNPAEALQLYQDVLKWDPNFREIKQKMQSLGGHTASTEREPIKSAPDVEAIQTASTVEAPVKQKDKKSRVSYI